MTPATRRFLYALLILAALLISFEIGRLTSFHREYRYRFGMRYAPFMLPLGPHLMLRGGHGAAGTLGGLSLPAFTVTAPDGSTTTVQIASSTRIVSDAGAASTSALENGERVIIIGEPGARGLEARVIRILASSTPR